MMSCAPSACRRCATRLAEEAGADGWFWSEIDLREQGPTAAAGAAALRAASAGRFWLHVDLDVLDPGSFSAAGRLRYGGLSWAELIELTTVLRREPACCGFSVCGYDAELDPDEIMPPSRSPTSSSGSPARAAGRCVGLRADASRARAPGAGPPGFVALGLELGVRAALSLLVEPLGQAVRRLGGEDRPRRQVAQHPLLDTREVRHVPADALLAAAEVVEQVRSHDRPAQAGAGADGAIDVGHARLAADDEVDGFAPERRREPVGDVARHVGAHDDGILAHRTCRTRRRGRASRGWCSSPGASSTSGTRWGGLYGCAARQRSG